VIAIMEPSFGAAQAPLDPNLRRGRARANDPKTAGAPLAGFGRLWPLVRRRRARMSRVQPSPGDRLDSWKEIAAYLNRGVRTVRRWEAVEGLPVHRQVHRTQGSVYAFKSEIETWRQSAARQPVSRSPAAAPARDPIKSIAVLPFTNLSADPENAYFADGLTDEVTADLSKVRALRVISRTSAMTFKGTAKDVKTIAGELAVRYVLEGSVRRAGGRLRITAWLIDASTDAHLWADKYDGTVADVFAFQERLARTIVSALELRLSTDEERRLAERPVASVQAYECYLRARQEIWRWRKDAIDRAVRLLLEGLETDGDSAGLYATLGLAHLQYREAGIDVGPGPLQEADACAQKVFALAPASLAGLQLRGWIDYSRGRVQEAVRDLKAALEIDPNNADTLNLLSNCYLISGKVTAARPLIARLLAVDPLTPVNRCMPGFADIMDGRFESAVDSYRQMFEMDPGNPMARLFYIWVLILNGRIDEVADIVAGFPAEVRGTIPARIASVLAHAVTGNVDGVHAAVSPEVEGVATATDLFPRFLAQGYALAGLPDRALYWLEIAIGRGFINYPFLAQHDPFFHRLRADSRFAPLMAAARDRWERFEL
jgi:TolB-like protein/thioredoxin-like negative regulator of GroEL